MAHKHAVYGYRLKFDDIIRRVKADVDATARKTVGTRIIAMLKAFVIKYRACRPIPRSWKKQGKPGIVGAFSTGKYANSFGIFFDGDPIESLIQKVKDGVYLPNEITVRNHASASKTGWQYFKQVEVEGWKRSGKPPYAPIRKAMAHVNSNSKFFRFGVDSGAPKYGAVVVTELLNNPPPIPRKSRGVSFTKGRSIKQQLNSKKRKLKK